MIFLLLFSWNAFATDYELQNLSPKGFSFYRLNDRASNRWFFQFENAQGSHFLIYEEAEKYSALSEFSSLRSFLNNPQSNCNLELECKAKAFCTSACKAMYYEFTNADKDPLFQERSNCKLKSINCEHRAGAAEVAAATPGKS